MFSFIKKYRNRRLKEKITLAYLSNPVISKDRDSVSDVLHIGLIYTYIVNPSEAEKIIDQHKN